MSDPIRLYLVRHGEAAQSWDEATDPSLSDLGRVQAHEAATKLQSVGPLPVMSSPLRRARETAAAFETIWGVSSQVNPRVTEFPSPPMNLTDRGAWLQRWQNEPWDKLFRVEDSAATLRSWRQGAIADLTARDRATRNTTHYDSIKVAVSNATNDDRIINFSPDNATCTVMERTDDGRKLVGPSRERLTSAS